MSEPALVRAARSDDLPALLAIEQASFGSAWSEGQIRAELDSDLAEVLLLEAPPGHPLASAFLRLVADEAELLRIAVRPEARGRGLGRRILLTVLSRMAAGGARVCHLEVSSTNVEARRLYASAGFRRLGTRPAYYPDGSDAELLALEIDRP